MTSSSRLTGYPWVLVTICHRRGYSCSGRLSPKPRGGSTKCTNFFVVIIYNMELLICAKGGMEKIACSCNPGFVLLASDCCIFTEARTRAEDAEGVTWWILEHISYKMRSTEYQPKEETKQSSLASLITGTTGRRGHDIFIGFTAHRTELMLMTKLVL